MVKKQELFIFDISRCEKDRINYEIIENIKNGIVNSPKYEACIKRFPTPHVFVFANCDPNEDAFTEDRIELFNINEQFNLKYEKYRNINSRQVPDNLKQLAMANRQYFKS
eukprot:TRINITY_DN19715_c0_g1_i1.p3 TRINITY_DN19715_c0_g1~~TRINITY_DN19715_c0_g1_i1.p3  ORF type:complete len:110 (+),score=18.58 TRINITY_DN19715_c0_g1_i1:821-1150(+)